MKTIAYYRSKYLAEAAGVRRKRVGRPPRQEVKAKILNLRQAGTRVSARRTSRLIREPRMTVYRHLKALGGNGRRCTRSLMCFHVVKRKKRVDLAGDLLDLLRDKKKWPRILTGDETWIYMNNHGAAEWVLPGEDRSVVQKKQIGDKKLMLIVFFCSSSGVHYSHLMEERESVNSETIMAAMSSIGTSLNTSETSKAWIHMDNASSHRAKNYPKSSERSLSHRSATSPQFS